MKLTDDSKTLHRLIHDFPFFAETFLRIRAKRADAHGEKIIPLRLNPAQIYLHERLEAQRREQGKVRALVLKGRQQGCSTYIGARFYHQTIFNSGIKTFIIAHLDDATDNLFTMVKRYHTSLTELAPIAPSTSYSNRKELVFDRLQSSYALATAGNKSAGRSDTIDLFHGSEVAFWANAADIQAGAMQAASEAMEIVLESTANGFDPMFHALWQDAESGRGEYQAIFIPWYWQEEYQAPVPDGFTLSREDEEYQAQYGLSPRQMAWRANKIIELKSLPLFRQEYPATAAEAFQLTGHVSYIAPEIVIKARKFRAGYGLVGPHFVGVDPAREGDDRTAFVHRLGRVAFNLEAVDTPDTMHIVGKIIEKLKNKTPKPVDRVFIDHSGGAGAVIFDILRERGWGEKVTLVNFGSRSVYQPDRYVNKRAEMWGMMRDWLHDEHGADIPDRDDLQADLCGPKYKFDSEQRVLLEAKADMKKRGIRSPDLGDALALTFAGGINEQATTNAVSFNKNKRIRVI